MSKSTEQKKFTNLVDELLRVPHAEIKAKLEAEKEVKKAKRKRKGK
jgi:hypothetical protein